MYLGRIVEAGPVEQVLERPLHPYTKVLLDAAPSGIPGGKKDPVQLEGDMPSPSSPPNGCYFHPRCPKVGEICRESYPEERVVYDGRRVSCHLPL